jgi:S-adenosylmethionine hydrolase
MKSLPLNKLCFFIAALLTCCCSYAQDGILVFQSDFGARDGAVAAMKGVAVSVSAELKIFDLTNEITPYDIWEAAYRLNQSATYWPAGTVFVSVVDPGVGSDRKSVVMKSRSGHYFVTPDNGTLTLVAETLGVEEVREIDESINRRNHSTDSYTFHGRDVYAYTGAKLAARLITFKEVGKKLPSEIKRISYEKATLKDRKISGSIDVLDIRYGNVWTNIPQSMLNGLELDYGDVVEVVIFHKGKMMFEGKIPFEKTFSAVPSGQPVAYLNSLLNFSIALNMANFAATYRIESGPDWRVVLSK